MKKYIQDFLLIIQFMTRIPINMNLPCATENFRRSTMFFPLVGFIIGGIQWIVYHFLIKFLPVNIVATIVIAVGVILTGGLHIDGLGDTIDGFFAFKGKDKIIDIMKDSRLGTYACIAIILDVLMRYTSISSISNNKLSLIIISVPVIARGAQVFLFYIGNTAKKTGSGNLFINNVGKVQLILALIITLGISCTLVGIRKTVITMSIALIFTSVFNRFCIRKIGGLTGDTLGANSELLELILFVLFIAIK